MLQIDYLVTLMALVQLTCLIGGDCDYKTIPLEYEQAKEQLNGHMEYAHRRPVVSRMEKPPRPVFSLNMTEADWQFKEIDWNSYIEQIESTIKVQSQVTTALGCL